ncbi:MAG: hypothetical protein II477_02975 [Lachnospiraceae bacterium]|nr:hypothetical protein [Lachnospiraceae bacterium]MBQ2100020.1 hypothetical protein [Lachnospiraceae bacterium]
MKRKVFLGLGIALLLFLVYVSYPRKIASLFPEDFTEHTIWMIGITEKGPSYKLVEGQGEELKEILASYEARRKVIKKKYDRGQGFAYRIVIEGVTDEIFFYSESELSIHDVQYKVYGAKSMAAEIEKVLEKAVKHVME